MWARHGFVDVLWMAKWDHHVWGSPLAEGITNNSWDLQWRCWSSWISVAGFLMCSRLCLSWVARHGHESLSWLFVIEVVAREAWSLPFGGCMGSPGYWEYCKRLSSLFIYLQRWPNVFENHKLWRCGGITAFCFIRLAQSCGRYNLPVYPVHGLVLFIYWLYLLYI